MMIIDNYQGGTELPSTTSKSHFASLSIRLPMKTNLRNTISLLGLSLNLELPASPLLTSDQFVAETHSYFTRAGYQN